MPTPLSAVLLAFLAACTGGGDTGAHTGTPDTAVDTGPDVDPLACDDGDDDPCDGCDDGRVRRWLRVDDLTVEGTGADLDAACLEAWLRPEDAVTVVLGDVTATCDGALVLSVGEHTDTAPVACDDGWHHLALCADADGAWASLDGRPAAAVDAPLGAVDALRLDLDAGWLDELRLSTARYPRGEPFAAPRHLDRDGDTVLLVTGDDGLLDDPDAPFALTVQGGSTPEDDTGTASSFCDGADALPAAVDDAFATDQDTALTVPAPGVLEGDIGSELVVAAIDGVDPDAPNALPSGATVLLSSDGGLVYDPTIAFVHLAEGDTAVDAFTYTAADGFGATSTASVAVTVTGLADPPTAVDDAFTTSEDDALAVPADAGLLANDTDPDEADVLTVATAAGAAPGAPVTLPSGAVLTVDSDGALSYDPAGAFDALTDGAVATDTFPYTIADPGGLTATATATITVTGVNDASVTSDLAFAVSEIDVLTVPAAHGLLSAASDVDGDPPVVATAAGAAPGAPPCRPAPCSPSPRTAGSPTTPPAPSSTCSTGSTPSTPSRSPSRIRAA